MHQIKISQTDISVDGTSIDGVTGISVETTADKVPEVNISVLPRKLDVDLLAELRLTPEIVDIYDAVRCLNMYMRIDDEFRRAVILSAKSAIDEVRHKNQMDVINDYALAKMIVERIFIGER